MDTSLIKQMAKDAENKPSVLKADMATEAMYVGKSDEEILKTYVEFRKVWKVIEEEPEDEVGKVVLEELEGEGIPAGGTAFGFGVVVLLTLNSLHRELSRRGLAATDTFQ